MPNSLTLQKGAPAAFLAFAVIFFTAQASAFEHRQGLRLGYQMDRVGAASAGPFYLHSPVIGYEGRYGSDWAASFRLSALFPLHASDGISKLSPPKNYDQIRSLDAFLGINRRIKAPQGFSFDTAFGPHAHFARFRSTRYVEWLSASMGLGVSASLRRLLGRKFQAGHLEWGGHVDLSYDFIDFAHGGDLRGVFSLALSVSIAFAGGTQR